MTSGDITLVDTVNGAQLAIQAAIRSHRDNATTGAGVFSFGQGERDALRGRIAAIDAELKLGRISASGHADGKFEILASLERLGEVLPPADVEFMIQVFPFTSPMQLLYSFLLNYLLG